MVSKKPNMPYSSGEGKSTNWLSCKQHRPQISSQDEFIEVELNKISSQNVSREHKLTLGSPFKTTAGKRVATVYYIRGKQSTLKQYHYK